MQLQAERLSLLVSKEEDNATEGKDLIIINRESVNVLKMTETLANLKVNCISSHGYLVLSLLLKSITPLI